MTDTQITQQPSLNINQDFRKRNLLVLGLVLQLLLIAAGLYPAVWLILHYAPDTHTAKRWALLILAAIIVFNYSYFIALLLLRIIIPRPKPGRYTIPSKGQLPRPVRVFAINLLLYKFRHDPPWAAMFAPVLTRIPPLGPLYRKFFGPKTTSTMILGDYYECLDPHMVTIGKNVEFGYRCIVTPHYVDGDVLVIGKIVIGDNVVIGGWAGVMADTIIGDHAVIGAASLVYPGSRVGPYEFWSGIPARKRRTLSRGEFQQELLEQQTTPPEQ